MGEVKAYATAVAPAAFITAVERPAKREDALVREAIFRRATGETMARPSWRQSFGYWSDS